jgi:heat shock protein HtpX
VMEMCVDNPREEFADLFDTHPPIADRITAIIKFAGGHDPGPLALPAPGESAPEQIPPEAPAAGPWGDAPAEAAGGTKPFLPPVPPLSTPRPSRDDGAGTDDAGPWGPHNRN